MSKWCKQSTTGQLPSMFLDKTHIMKNLKNEEDGNVNHEHILCNDADTQNS